MILAASMDRDTIGIEDSITRLKRGELDALARLIEQYQHRLYRFLLRVTGDAALAEDVFQQTWLRVIERIGQYDARRSFDPWLFSVGRNLAIDQLRRNPLFSLDSMEKAVEAPVARLATTERNPLERLLEFERGALLNDAVSALPFIHREVITLRFEEDLKLEEISEIAGVPLSTVKSRLLRALESLRGRLERR